MSDEKSYIVKPRDPAEIVRTQDSAALTEFLKDPPSVIAGALIESLSHGPSALTAPLVRIGVSALRGRALQQLANEIKELRGKGKLADDFAERKYGFQTWVELIEIIDSDAPDEDRLKALKAMFFAANKLGASEGQQVVAYQLFQIAKRLSSNELLILKSVYERFKKETQFHSNDYRQWVQAVAGSIGHSSWGLVELADKALVDSCLLTPRYGPDLSSISSPYWRLTDLGRDFCQNVESYTIETKS
jgi:hypothetical protein